MTLLERLKSEWPANFQLQPINAEERRNVIEIQALKKGAALEIERLTNEIKQLMDK